MSVYYDKQVVDRAKVKGETLITIDIRPAGGGGDYFQGTIRSGKRIAQILRYLRMLAGTDRVTHDEILAELAPLPDLPRGRRHK